MAKVVITLEDNGEEEFNVSVEFDPSVKPDQTTAAQNMGFHVVDFIKAVSEGGEIIIEKETKEGMN